MTHRVQLKARGGQLTAYSGRSILVTDLDGYIRSVGTQGFYYKNTRILSRLEMLVDGEPLIPASVSPVGADRLLGYYEAHASASVPERTLYVEVTAAVAEDVRFDYRITNFGKSGRIACPFALALAADFADSDEAESGRRRQCGEIETTWQDECRELRFHYHLANLQRCARVRTAGDLDGLRFTDGELKGRIEIEARQALEFSITVAAEFESEPVPVMAWRGTDADRALSALRSELAAGMPRLESADPSLDRAWKTASADLATLPLGLEGAPAVPIAGFPLYQQFFGRDSLTISWQALVATPLLMRDSLRANAAWQGTKIDDFFDEEPGKMIHQARWGPTSELRLDPFRRYYGDWATPVDFLIMAGQYYLWTGDKAEVRGLLPAMRRALAWCDRYGDPDGDGFLEYRSRSPVGVEHQGWKDSHDAIVDSAGNVIAPPVAASEIQGYWYAALQQAAVVFLACGDRVFGLRLLAKAQQLRKRFNDAFWMEDEGFYAMAFGPDHQRVDSISSNAGHLLAAGIVPRDHAQTVAAKLMAPNMFSGWGIRTLSSENPFFNPFSYHRGSVWPVEQATIAFGLARYGCWDHLHTLVRGVLDLADLFAENRLPEVVSGIARDEAHPHPGIYPYSCEPQGWSASMVVMLVQALLGLRPIAPLDLLIVDPHLPEWLPELRLSGLRVGASRFDLRAWRRKDGGTAYRVENRSGPVRVIRQPVPGEGSGLRRRAVDLLFSLPRS